MPVNSLTCWKVASGEYILHKVRPLRKEENVTLEVNCDKITCGLVILRELGEGKVQLIKVVKREEQVQ